MDNMSSNSRLTEPGGTQSTGVPACHCFGGWEGHSKMFVATKGPRLASKVSATHGFPLMPSV